MTLALTNKYLYLFSLTDFSHQNYPESYQTLTNFLSFVSDSISLKLSLLLQISPLFSTFFSSLAEAVTLSYNALQLLVSEIASCDYSISLTDQQQPLFCFFSQYWHGVSKFQYRITQSADHGSIHRR